MLVYLAGLDLRDNLPANNIRTLYPQFMQTQRQLEDVARSGLGDSHPKAIALHKQLADLQKQLNDEALNLRATLQAKLDLANHRLESMEELIGETREKSVKRSLDALDYAYAKRKFETEQQMQLKLFGEQVREKVKLADH